MKRKMYRKVSKRKRNTRTRKENKYINVLFGKKVKNGKK